MAAASRALARESPTSLWASTRASPARTRACLPCARERGEAPRGEVGDRRREEEEALTADVARAEVDAEADAEGVEVQSPLVDGRNCSAPRCASPLDVRCW